MKKLFFFVLLLPAVAMSQTITDTATLRTRVNADIVPNSNRSITAQQVQNIFNGILNTRNILAKYTDTAAMLSPYVRTANAYSGATAVKYTDTAGMLSPYLRTSNAYTGVAMLSANNNFGAVNYFNAGANFNQRANNATISTLDIFRNSDVGPLGYFIRGNNFAGTTVPFSIDVTGNYVGGSFSGTTGTFSGNITAANFTPAAYATLSANNNFGAVNYFNAGANFNQRANNATISTLDIFRNSDVGPLGYFIRGNNQAGTTVPFSIDVTGNYVGGSFSGTTGTFSGNITAANFTPAAYATLSANNNFGAVNYFNAGANFNQRANNATISTLDIFRNSDVGPLGYFIRGNNQAGTTVPFSIDVTGNYVGGSFTGTIGTFSGNITAANFTPANYATLSGANTFTGVNNFNNAVQFNSTAYFASSPYITAGSLNITDVSALQGAIIMSTPTLQKTIRGSLSSSLLYADTGRMLVFDRFSRVTGTSSRAGFYHDNTADRTYRFPDSSGTVAFVDFMSLDAVTKKGNTVTGLSQNMRYQGINGTLETYNTYYNQANDFVHTGISTNSNKYGFIVSNRNFRVYTLVNKLTAVFDSTGSYFNGNSTYSCDSSGNTKVAALKVTAGVVGDGGGLKHNRVSTGSIAANSSALVTVTWGTPFADANYTVTTSVQDATTSSSALSVVHIESITASAVTVRVNNTSAGALGGILHIMAMHDSSVAIP